MEIVNESPSHRASRERLFNRIEPTGFCWLWKGKISDDGYAITTLYGKTEAAHRAVWKVLMGDIAKGLQLDHLCNVRHCVNPDHLEPVTKRENAARMVERRGWVHGGVGKRPFGPQQRRKQPVRKAPLRPLMSQREFCVNGHRVSDLGVMQKTVKGALYEVCTACSRAQGQEYAGVKKAKFQAKCITGLCKHVRCGTLPKKAFAGGNNPIKAVHT